MFNFATGSPLSSQIHSQFFQSFISRPHCPPGGWITRPPYPIVVRSLVHGLPRRWQVVPAVPTHPPLQWDRTSLRESILPSTTCGGSLISPLPNDSTGTVPLPSPPHSTSQFGMHPPPSPPDSPEIFLLSEHRATQWALNAHAVSLSELASLSRMPFPNLDHFSMPSSLLCGHASACSHFSKLARAWEESI